MISFAFDIPSLSIRYLIKLRKEKLSILSRVNRRPYNIQGPILWASA